MNLPTISLRSAAGCALLAGLAAPALAHHGFGLFQMDQEGTWSGTLTKMNLVNPHSYMEFDMAGANGETVHMRCEMRAATLLRRAGWDTDMFTVGAHVEIFGRPHRDDPTACYIETFTLDDSVEVSRNDQFTTTAAVDYSNRPLRLADGQLNLSGDWAVEQLVLTIGPAGGSGSMVPKSFIEEFASGEMTMQQIQATQPPRPTIAYTEEGQAAAAAFRRGSPEDNPWFACKPTSFIRDWTADWPINRFVRRIHVGMAEHPANLEPSYAGHSIGRWEGDTLVVDTIGFAAGVLTPPTRNSEQLHIVERFTLDPATMALKREYSATDPVYLTAPYASYDVMYLSDVPFQAQPCQDMTPEFQQDAN
jgi:hypothetical protein